MSIVLATELSTWLRETVKPEAADIAIQLAEGWVLAAVSPIDPSAAWPPEPIPADLWAWAVELAGLAYKNNPYPVSQRNVGGVVTMWDTSASGRRTAILTAVGGRYGSVGSPRGSFPPALSWPDSPERPSYPDWYDWYR